MCDKHPFFAPVSVKPIGVGLKPVPVEASSAGSRRPRLWELDPYVHCPLAGVCLPLERLRALAVKAAAGKRVPVDDYVLHCEAVTECRHRTPLAELVQKELDRRFMISLRQAARCRNGDELLAWWAEARAAHDIAGPFWAVLSHPRATQPLRDHVLGDVHMLQHQVGAAARADVQALRDLLQEKKRLEADLADERAARDRVAREADRDLAALHAELLRLRAQVVTQTSLAATAQTRYEELRASVPELKSREALATQLAHERERAAEAQREAGRLRRLIEGMRAIPDDAGPRVAPSAAPVPPAPAAALANRAVLCVGGRTAQIPAYRHLIEDGGARFLHHDGGAEESVVRLESTLAAADLVICQTGCVSHDAYWRVKEHCKRTGKPCVFVDQPSRSGLARALAALVSARLAGATVPSS